MDHRAMADGEGSCVLRRRRAVRCRRRALLGVAMSFALLGGAAASQLIAGPPATGEMSLSVLLDDGRRVTLDLKPLRVVGPNTKFVVGRPSGADVPFSYDVSQVEVLHGHVHGHEGSSVVLFRSPRGSRSR